MGVRRLTHFVDGNQDHIRHLGDVLGDRLGRRLRLLLGGTETSGQFKGTVLYSRWRWKEACLWSLTSTRLLSAYLFL